MTKSNNSKHKTKIHNKHNIIIYRYNYFGYLIWYYFAFPLPSVEWNLLQLLSG